MEQYEFSNDAYRFLREVLYNTLLSIQKEKDFDDKYKRKIKDLKEKNND